MNQKNGHNMASLSTAAQAGCFFFLAEIWSTVCLKEEIYNKNLFFSLSYSLADVVQRLPTEVWVSLNFDTPDIVLVSAKQQFYGSISHVSHASFVCDIQKTEFNANTCNSDMFHQFQVRIFMLRFQRMAKILVVSVVSLEVYPDISPLLS